MNVTMFYVNCVPYSSYYLPVVNTCKKIYSCFPLGCLIARNISSPSATIQYEQSSMYW